MRTSFLITFIFLSGLLMASSLEENCKKGDAVSCKDLGKELHKKGNVIGASKFYSTSCKLKNGEGCYHEGHLEEVDLRNPDFAIHKYQDACRYGYSEGCTNFERLRSKGIKTAKIVKKKSILKDFRVVEERSLCIDNICKSEIENACRSGAKGVEKYIKEKHSPYKMKLVCTRLISPENPSVEHSNLQENFKKSITFAYRKYCETAVYGRVVSFEETKKTDPKIIETWKRMICSDTLYPPDPKELTLRNRGH